MTHLTVAFEILCLIKNSKKHWGITADEIIAELNQYTSHDVNMGIDYLENHDFVRRRLFTANETEKAYSKKAANTKREVFFLTTEGEQAIVNGGFSGRSKKNGAPLEVNIDWIPNEDHVAAISEEETRLIFEQSEKMLLSLVAIKDMLVSRMARLLTITMSIMTLFLCYSFFRFDRYQALDIELLSFIFGVVYLFAVSATIILNIGSLKKDTTYVGTEPKVLFNDMLLSRSSNNIKQFYISKIIDHQNRILLCRKKNKATWSVFNTLLWLTVLIPVVVLLIYWVLRFFI